MEISDSELGLLKLELKVLLELDMEAESTTGFVVASVGFAAAPAGFVADLQTFLSRPAWLLAGLCQGPAV